MKTALQSAAHQVYLGHTKTSKTLRGQGLLQTSRFAWQCYSNHVNERDIRRAKRQRRIRKILPVFWREFWAPLWNMEQLLSLIVAFATTALIFASADREAMSSEKSEWELAARAMLFALPAWAVLMLVRAPFVVAAEERRKGTWHGARFIYNRPELVATIRCKATGKPQFHALRFSDAEPGSFVYYIIEVEGDPPRQLYSASVVQEMIMVGYDTEPGRGANTGGLRIGNQKEAQLLIVMKEKSNSQTVRVYMRDFSIGDPLDQDGIEGEFKGDFKRVAPNPEQA